MPVAVQARSTAAIQSRSGGPGGSTSSRRLSREESRAQTRARLIAVGREHFLTFGLGNAVAEKIAEEAGFSRGALYSNFDGKDDLFVAVMQQEHERYCEMYNAIFRESLDSTVLLRDLRSTYINMLMNPEWVILWADFQSEAVRNPAIQERYRQFYEAMVQDSVQRLTEHIDTGRLRCKVVPSQFVLAMSSFAHGLAMRHRLLGSQLPENLTRGLIGELFDSLISAP